jgi:hypothetical protein
MPDPVKKPPESLVNEETTRLTFEIGKMFNDVPMAYDRLVKQQDYALKRLAYLEAFIKHNEIEV